MKEKQITVVDKIRSLNDEALAEFLAKRFYAGLGAEWVLQWLQSETKEET